MSVWRRFYFRLIRRKNVREDELENTNLARCLSVIDLTALGVGSTLGAGAYVISGQVAKSDAGPAVIISFLIAAIASMLAGLCYAEFGSRVPKAGSAYIYTFVTVGEFIAFIIGWNLILEYVIGSASVARTSSGYVDNLIGTGTLINWFQETMPMDIPTFAPYFDLFAFGITMLLAVLLAIGVKESATFTKVFTGLNLCILSYIIIIGAFKDDPANWAIPESKVPNTTEDGSPACGTGSCGTGGFSPYGFSGIMSGAATCFFAFVGFDAIATTGEEAKNPQKAIPVATVLSLTIVFVFYTAISITITMMAPYYSLDSNAPFSVIFEDVGWTVSMYIVGIGAVCALSTRYLTLLKIGNPLAIEYSFLAVFLAKEQNNRILLGAMFPLPRVVFAMARDGIVFRFLAIINKRFKTPVIATLLSGLLAATMAALFDVESLVDMMSIGTLLAYTLVSACVMLLRYEADRHEESVSEKRIETKLDSRNFVVKLFKPNANYPTQFSGNAVKALTCILAVWLIVLGCMLTFGHLDTAVGIAMVAIFAFLSVFTVFLIWLQPQNPRKLLFMVPAVPFFPALSMFFNIFLIINLNELTFLRFIIWMAIGFIIYFGYGMWHSSEEIQLQSLSTKTTIPSEFGVHTSGLELNKTDSNLSIDEKVLNGFTNKIS